MIRTDFYATTALGICLTVAPLPASAQLFGNGPDGVRMLAPAVQSCLATPELGDCQQTLTAMTECAQELVLSRCGFLFVDAEAVFSDPAQREQAQVLLDQTREAISQQRLAEDDPARQAPQRRPVRSVADTVAQAPVGAEAEAAERRLVEAMEAEERVAESEAEAEDDRAEPLETEEEAEPAPPAAETLATEPRAPEAEMEMEMETETETEMEADRAEPSEPEMAADPAPQAVVAPEAEKPAPETDAPQQDESEERLRTALEAEQREAEGDAEPEGTIARTDADFDLAQERARLRAEAEAMAADEPELIVESAPEEEFVAPADPERELDSEEQGALARIMENPEIAAAVALLDGATEPSDEEQTQDQPRTGVATALSALRRSRAGDGDRDDTEGAEAAEVTEEAIMADEVRSSRDDFESRFAMDFEAGQARRNDRRDLERAGLIALGALAVGMIINHNRVVARSDERIVVIDRDGEYAVWRDDDANLRQEGSRRRIERYNDGSTLTRWHRADGSQIVTIRDATGRLMWRERILRDGTSIQLVNDMRVVEPIDVSFLPAPRRRELRISQRTDPELALALLRDAEADARALDRFFTLRQVREIRELRELVPVLSPEPITFETNRANVRPEEAPKLAQLGRLLERLIADNPRELFLIEGHTDATGPASFNLALSDRRAESVALALTEFFDIPPENLIIQGYGERYLRIPTAAAEERNRRVAVRRISPLLGL